MAVPIVLDHVSAVATLERLCAANESCEAQLPSGRMVLVLPMAGVGDVAAALDDPEFRAQIQQSAAEYAAGKVVPFTP